MKCVIPCAGESSRMSYVPKHLIRIGDKPLLRHITDAWQGIADEFIFVLKRSMTYMWELLPEGSAVVFQDEPLGLADAILRAEPYVRHEPFVVSLGDCVFRGRFKPSPNPPFGVGVWKTSSLTELNKSYLVESHSGRLLRVIEKPNLTEVDGPMNCGMGTYFMSDEVFRYIRKCSVEPGGGDFTYVLQDMINAEEYLSAVPFEGKYINVTGPEDIEKAAAILEGGGA